MFLLFFLPLFSFSSYPNSAVNSISHVYHSLPRYKKPLFITARPGEERSFTALKCKRSCEGNKITFFLKIFARYTVDEMFSLKYIDRNRGVLGKSVSVAV